MNNGTGSVRSSRFDELRTAVGKLQSGEELVKLLEAEAKSKPATAERLAGLVVAVVSEAGTSRAGPPQAGVTIAILSHIVISRAYSPLGKATFKLIRNDLRDWGYLLYAGRKNLVDQKGQPVQQISLKDARMSMKSVSFAFPR